MRTAILLLCGSAAAFAADPFLGDWKLDVSKSTFADGRAAKDGRALIEPDNSGGYLQISETVFTDGPPLRFNSRVQLDGTPGDGALEDRQIRYKSRRIDADTFEISIDDGTITGRTLRVSASAGSLKMEWFDQRLKPSRALVYEKAPQGPVLETGKTIEHAFGPGATIEYRINLKAGEYCEGAIEQKGGTINAGAYAPDGARLHSFGGPPDGKNRFALLAESTGTYRLVLRSAVKPAKSYAITVDKIEHIAARTSPSKEQFTSPRIAQLKKDLNVAAFWSEIEKRGAPLVEPMEGDSPDAKANNLVTFVWRAKAETHNVLILFFPYAVAHPQDFEMVPIASTDVWYRTVKIRRGARFAYQLSPNDPLTFDESSFARTATSRADPLNPHHWFENPGNSKFEYQSVVEMPDAKPQPYIAKRDVPAGKVEKSRITSALLKNTRDLSIYTPPGYSKTGPPNGLLVVFDEGAYLTLVPTPVILDNLLSEKKIAPMVAVFIANPDQDTRTRELPPNPAFADFLNNELIPWVRANYNVTTDPRQTVVAGSSFGGIASVYAGLRHPETFGNILCQSGSFWWSAPKPEPYAEPNYLAKEFLKSPKLPLKFYMDAGTFEVDMNGGGGAILEPSRHMRDVLLAQGYEVHYQENVGGHDYLSWRGSLADGLIALVGR